MDIYGLQMAMLGERSSRKPFPWLSLVTTTRGHDRFVEQGLVRFG